MKGTSGPKGRRHNGLFALIAAAAVLRAGAFTRQRVQVGLRDQTR